MAAPFDLKDIVLMTGFATDRIVVILKDRSMWLGLLKTTTTGGAPSTGGSATLDTVLTWVPIHNQGV